MSIISTFHDCHFYEILPKKWRNLFNSEQQRTGKTDLNQSFMLLGDSGIGKTHESILFLRDWCLKQFPGGYQTYLYRQLPEFIEMHKFSDYVREANGFNDETKYGARNRLKNIKECSLLIFDDLWIENGTDRENKNLKNELFEIFDFRFNEGLQTVVTTNNTVLELENCYEKRFVSRLKGLCQLGTLINQKDLRIKF